MTRSTTAFRNKMPKRMIEEAEKEWEVTAIRFRGGKRPFRVWWKVGGNDDVEISQISGISEEFQTYARTNPDFVVRLNVSGLRKENQHYFAQIDDQPSWIPIQKHEVLPNLMNQFLLLPESQQIKGAQLSTSSMCDLGCAPYALVKLVPGLADFKHKFESFKYGAVIGHFMNWVRNSYFGEYRINPKRCKLDKEHVFDYLMSPERQEQERYVLQVTPSHTIAVEYMKTEEGQVHGLIHCALQPDVARRLSWETFQQSGGSRSFQGKIWLLNVIEMSYN